MANTMGKWFIRMVRTISLAGAFLLLLTSSQPANAAEVMITPSVNVSVAYDSNATAARTDAQEDFYTKINPKLATRYATERFRSTFDIGATAVRNKNITGYDDEYYTLNATTEYALTERLTMNLGGYYYKDSTAESDLEETGRVYFRQDRKRWNLNAGLGFALTEQTNLRFTANKGRTQYQAQGRVDSEYVSANLTLSHRLDNAKDTVSLQPYYSQSKSQASTVDSYGLVVGLEHPFNEEWSLSTFAGLRYTNSDVNFIQTGIVSDPSIYPPYRVVYFPVNRSESNLGWTADLGLSKKSELYTAALHLKRDLSYSSYGDAVNTNRLSFDLDYKWTERIGTGLLWQYYTQKSFGDFSNTDRVYTSINPFIRYNITRDAFFRLDYGYSNNKDKRILRDNETNRHVVTLSFEIAAPKQY